MKEGVIYSRCSIAVAAAMSWRHRVFYCESETNVFGLPKEYTPTYKWFSYIYNTVPEQYNVNIWVCVAHFTEDWFLNLGESSLQCEHYCNGLPNNTLESWTTR